MTKGRRAVVWAMLAISVTLASIAMWIAWTTSPSAPLDAGVSLGYAAITGTLVLAFSLIGALILARRPENGVGWLFVIDGTLIAILSFASVYGYRALTADPGSLPVGALVEWLTDVLYLPLFALLTVYLFLLYPDGRLRSTHERRTAMLATAGVALGAVGNVIEPTLYSHPDIENPLGLGVPRGLAYAFAGVGFMLVALSLVASVVLLVHRLRRARGVERDQLRLLVWAAVVGVCLFMPSFFGVTDTGIGVVIAALGILLIPVSVGLAILRHGLFDIDLVIRKTLVFGLLAASITIVYVAVVVSIPALLLGRRAGGGADLLPFFAAALIAIAFQPIRQRAQRIATRIVYGTRATPYEVMAELARRMSVTLDADDLLPRIARVVAEGTKAERADVWLRVGRKFQPAAVWPPRAATRPVVAIDGGGLPELPGDVVAAVTHDGEILGALTMDRTPGETASTTERRLLEDVASQAGIALRNVGLLEELRASRQRLVAAQDEERRKLERNIHDGAQQQLVALAVKVQLADKVVDADAEKAHRILAQVRDETQDALETLRDLARGIYPPLLADKGLSAALEAQARKSTLPVVIRADGLSRYHPEVEATVYFCCLEALQNASKYSGASSVVVSLVAVDGQLSFEVSDDGRGFDPPTTPRGSGLQNMIDRLDAMGGALEIGSSPGTGTRLFGRIPFDGRRDNTLKSEA